MTWEQDRQAISRALEDAQHDLQLRFSQNELWRDHHCLFHQDDRRSASWQEGTGIYYCRSEDRRFAVPEVLLALALPVSGDEQPQKQARPLSRERARSPRRHRDGDQEQDTQRRPERPADAIYEYYWPDGALSHRKLRWGDGEAKVIAQEGVNGESRLPKERWPLYGDFGAEPGSAWLVVEGEKACDRVLAAGDLFRGRPLRALTAGSSSDLRRHARALAARLGELEPAHLLIWPDNDSAGFEAAQALAKVFREVGLRFQVAKPGRYNLPLKAGVDDYLDLGGSLADAFAQHFSEPQNGELSRLVRLIAVTHSQRFVFPGSRRLVTIAPEMVKPVWLRETGEMPSPRLAEELAARLRLKAMEQPSRVVYRLAATATSLWWRPAAEGMAYRVDGQGVHLDDDPPNSVLALPSEEPAYPVTVDESGARTDLEELTDAFGLNATETAMVEGWLVAAFCGLQCPILLLRAPAGTGKSTLARFIMAVLEPVVPHLDVRERGMSDQRELVRALERSPGLILDNVSRMSSEMEDLMSKLVTGLTTTVRTLYEDSIEMLRMSRGLIVTTTNWDVFKGDLASRMVVAQPHAAQSFNWLSDQGVLQLLSPLIPRIRGHVFHQAVRFYNQRQSLLQRTTPFRVGDLGMVFAALGYDVDDLARREASAKSEVIAINDPWLEAMVQLWKRRDSVSFAITTTDLCHDLQTYGCEDIPPSSSPKLARWIGEKGPMFRDHGFMVEPAPRKGSFRGYRFYRSQPGRPQEDTEPAE